jgi:hypothetical protein
MEHPYRPQYVEVPVEEIRRASDRLSRARRLVDLTKDIGMESEKNTGNDRDEQFNLIANSIKELKSQLEGADPAAPALSRRESISLAVLQTLIGMSNAQQRQDPSNIIREAFKIADAFMAQSKAV